MRLTFAKGTGKYDHLQIDRAGLPQETVQCPKQGIIPHDMIHYAVESIVPHRGFLSLLRDGKPADYATQGDNTADAIERLVETFQAEMWSGRIATAEAIALYEHGCKASGHAVAPVSDRQVEAIRLRIDALTEAWAKVPAKGTLTVIFDGAAPQIS